MDVVRPSWQERLRQRKQPLVEIGEANDAGLPLEASDVAPVDFKSDVAAKVAVETSTLDVGKSLPGEGFGDWSCPGCQDFVFARNMSCHKCGTRKPDSSGIIADTECEILNRLVLDANPDWNMDAVKGAKKKLRKVGVTNHLELEAVLRERGELNKRLRAQQLKAFGSTTLARLRSQIESERQMSRVHFLLEERRRLDRECKRRNSIASASGAAASVTEENASEGSADDQDAEDVANVALPAAGVTSGSSANSESTQAFDVASSSPSHHEPISSSQDDYVEYPDLNSDADVVSPLPVTCSSSRRLSAPAPHRPHAEKPEPRRCASLGYHAAQAAGRREALPGLAKASLLAKDLPLPPASGSWEWPLTRPEKKERITMLDRQVLLSYNRELARLAEERRNPKALDDHTDSSEGECAG